MILSDFEVYYQPLISPFRPNIVITRFIRQDKRQTSQRNLLETYLKDILNPRDKFVHIGRRIDWPAYEQHFGQLYAVETKRPVLPFHLHVSR